MGYDMTLLWANMLRALSMMLNIYAWIIIANVLLSWFLSPQHTVKQFLERITAPVLDPFRNITSRFTSSMPIDIAPLLAIIVLNVAKEVLNMFANQLLR